MTSIRRPGGTSWLLLAAVLVATACSSHESVSPELGPLYSRIREYRADYEEGIGLIVSGEAVRGRNMLAAATKRIGVAAEECARTPGCDMNLFVDAMGDLLEERTLDPTGPGPSAAWIAYRAEEADPAKSALVEAIPEIDRTIGLLHGTDLNELIPLNGPVKAALNHWLTWNRPELMEAYENYQFLREKVAPIYEEAELPEALLFAMMAKETRAKVHAYSRAGAAGPLQFMPRTARRYGLGSVDGFDMRLDPVASTKANAAYLNDQFRALNNDLEKVLAAYNGGESRVRRLHRTHEGAEFWDPQIYYALPTETREYVPQILAAARLFLHPEEHGLEFPDLETSTTSITLEDDTSLGELTVCLGQAHNPNGWFRTLRNLNPRLPSTRRIPAGGTVELPSMLVPVYSERCVGDAPLLTLARQIHDADYPEKPATAQYTVRRGDTLAKIAELHRCSVRELADINDIEGPGYVVHPGQRLTVPGCG